ncbi:hypothetical protein DPMN_186624 [Dreissena polymorpha]|uniref:Uncharacterized protein n=1 Tax=Dreissena polymorpha TaxID=45954 RepID=A0A9D4DMI0_DREPO|nr:hypothetical protein DPMN_186624 [Dreissena polymorpha]
MQNGGSRHYSTCERTAAIQTEEEEEDDSPDYAIDFVPNSTSIERRPSASSCSHRLQHSTIIVCCLFLHTHAFLFHWELTRYKRSPFRYEVGYMFYYENIVYIH